MKTTDHDISNAIDFLIYANYKHNRMLSPDTPVTSYMKIYPKHLVLEMEALLKTESKPGSKINQNNPCV